MGGGAGAARPKVHLRRVAGSNGVIFRDREDAGRLLGERLAGQDVAGPVVLGIARGGVIVASAAARVLGAPLDVIVPTKVRAPGQPELGLGAVAPDGTTYLDPGLIERLGVSALYLQREVDERRAEALRRTEAYRGGGPPVALEGRTAIVVDDGIATGGTAICAVRSVRNAGPAEVVLAAPVAPLAGLSRLEREAGRAVFLQTPADFLAVGQWYESFDQVSDEEVRAALGEPGR